MLTVYAVPVSLYCAKLRILLRHKALAWEEVPPPGGYGSDAYRQIVPSGNLPALVDGDLLIADSEAIAEYLNEKHPEPPMLPASLAGRARARERSRFHDTRLEPAVRALFGAVGAARPGRDVLSRQGEAISARLAQFARMLETGSDHGPGDGGGQALTLGDCGFPVTFAWIDALDPVLRLSIDWPAAVLAYREALASHAAVAAELAGYCATLDTWLEAQTTAT